MKLLTENILTDNGNFNGCRAYSEYVGFFEHTRENGEVMLIKIDFNNNHNDEDLTISMFTKNGFVRIASFNDIQFLQSIPHYKYCGDKFVKMVKSNNGTIEEWLNIVFH
jgi:hypothetical protein